MYSRSQLTRSLGIGLLLVLLPAVGLSQSGGDTLDERPNIVLINLDDADADLLKPAMLDAFYPQIRQMAERGLRFSNMHATTPFCAPSRAALFRGQYAFSTGIKVNDTTSIISNGFTGSFDEFLLRGHHNNELGVWLKDAGYRTMHVGKYHHHGFNGQVPPGWDDFRMTAGAKYFGANRFSNDSNPQGVWETTGADEYVTTVNRRDAVELIHQQGVSTQPFFLYVAPIAPHAANTFVPEDMVDTVYENFADGHELPETPDLHEEDVSDKPKHLRLTTTEHRKRVNRRAYISRVRAIKSIDDMLGQLLQALEVTGALENTYVFLTSDNGYQLGHHNLRSKTDPFHRTTNVPLLVMGPEIPAGFEADHLLAHIDLCPTILELAGVPIPSLVEARSFEPLLFEPDSVPAEDWQDGILIENWVKKGHAGQKIMGSYVAYRQHHEIFVSWANGEYEYYDLETDPYQLDNRYSSLTTPEKQTLKRFVRRFRSRRIEPITTLDPVYASVPQSRNIKLRGFAEDDAGVFSTLVTMRSATTNRFWNGTDWQDDWFGHLQDVENRNQPITTWNFRTRVTTETESGLDYLIFTYRSIDSDGVLPHQVAYHVNQVDGKDPVANFATNVAQPVFTGNVVLGGSYFDAVAFDKALLTIRNIGTQQYFNGTSFQSERIDLIVDLLDESSWQFQALLPPGNYRGGIRGVDAVGNVQRPADSIRFSVE